MIRILITGSRMWDDVPLLTASLDEQARGHDQVTLIHGRCDPRNTAGERIPWDDALAHPENGPYCGGDWHGHQHAVVRGWAIEEYAANWFLHGNSAGPIRNQRMVDLRPVADVCVGAPLGKSPGTGTVWLGRGRPGSAWLMSPSRLKRRGCGDGARIRTPGQRCRSASARRGSSGGTP